MRLGIFGGAFDPIHNAHRFIAESARLALSLDKVVFIPTGVAHHKPARRLAPAEDRFAMVSLAIEGNPAFEVSRMEIDRPGPSYSVETLRAFKSKYPDAELFFLIGVDALAEIGTWKQPEEVLRLATIVAFPRPGSDPGAIGGTLPREAAKCVILLDAPEIGISSTIIRDRIRKGFSIRYVLPDAVEAYIEERRLYRK